MTPRTPVGAAAPIAVGMLGVKFLPLLVDDSVSNTQTEEA